MRIVGFLVGVVALASLLGGCATSKPEVGDRFEVLEQTTGHRDLSAYDRALYEGGQRGDRVAIERMLDNGEVFVLEPGISGEILDFPRPAMMKDYRGCNLNDWLHSVASVRIDQTGRMAVIHLDNEVKVIKSKKPSSNGK